MKICVACDCPFEAEGWRCPHCGHTPMLNKGYLMFAPDVNDAGFEIEYFEQLVKAEEGNFWFEARNKMLLWALERYLPHKSAFLEIGCGTGYVMRGIRQQFPAWTLVGSDIFTEAIPYAASRAPGTNFMQFDARRIPYEREFDGIGAFDVLEHIAEDTAVIAQMYRALKPGGHVVINVPQHPQMWSPVDEYWEHQRRYSRQEMLDKLTDAGFEPVYVTSFVSLLFPVMWLSRKYLNLRRQKYNPYQEYKTGIASVILKSMMGVERFLIQRGLRFPMGGSLLVVAKRPS